MNYLQTILYINLYYVNTQFIKLKQYIDKIIHKFKYII